MPNSDISHSKTQRRKEEIAFYLRATCTVAQACAGTGIGRTLLYELMSEKIVESSTVRRRRVINVPSLLKAVGFKLPVESANKH